jgi:hypothetical protein
MQRGNTPPWPFAGKSNGHKQVYVWVGEESADWSICLSIPVSLLCLLPVRLVSALVDCLLVADGFELVMVQVGPARFCTCAAHVTMICMVPRPSTAKGDGWF